MQASVALMSAAAGSGLGPAVLGVGAWVLGIVFLWSGAAKARRPRLAALAMVDFGVTSRPRTWLGWTLAAGEICLGTALLSGVAGVAFRAVALVLLAAFSVLLARSLRASERFPCRCFGGEDKAISAGTLLRTLGLAVVAGVLLLASVLGVTGAGPLGGALHLRATAAVALVALLTLLSRVPELLDWNHETVERFRALAELESASQPEPGGRRVLPLQEVAKS